MAEITENMEKHEEYASNSKANAALTTGIIGTALGAISMGVGGGALFGGTGSSKRCKDEDWILRNERKSAEDRLEMTKQRYEDKIQLTSTLTDQFFKLYQQDIDNSWMLYKNHIDDSFALYKKEQDDREALQNKINEVDRKVEVMAAIRPYQDALINAKIDNVALVGDFNLAKRTCRMIQGELVLPSTPTVTGYPSYSAFNYIPTPVSGATA